MRKFCWLAVLVPMLGGCVDSAPEPTPEPASEASTTLPDMDVQQATPRRERVRCVILGEPTCIAGQAPTIHVALVNQTDAEIYLVGSLDGSDVRFRYPHCYFEVIGPDGKLVEPRGGRCGNVNPIEPWDFVSVPPGASFDPYQCIDGRCFFGADLMRGQNFQHPGTYRIRFKYSTIDSKSPNDGPGDGLAMPSPNQEIVRRSRLVPRVNVESEEFVLTVVAAKE